MRLRASSPSLLALGCLAATAVYLPAPVAAAHVPAVPAPCPAGRDASAGVIFPVLTWLRDSAVELVFGKPPARARRPDRCGPLGGLRGQYGDHIVVRLNVTTAAEEAALADAVDRLFLDVWAVTRDFVDVRIRKDSIGPMLKLLPVSLHAYTVLISDVAAAAWATYPKAPGQEDLGHNGVEPFVPGQYSDSIDNVFFRDYQPLSVVTQWMRLLATLFPGHVRMINIGESYEAREIPALRVGKRPADGETSTEPRKTIVITGGVHAREWISVSTVNYAAWSFITAFGREPMITKLLRSFDLVFVPVANPDGYEYTWQADRLWRKTRQPTGLRFCRGMDLDHAFGFEWESDSRGAGEPCSESYGGAQPFQAVEAHQLARWARNETAHGTEFVGFLDLHSYSQQVLFPFSYTCSKSPSNVENLQELAVGIAKAIRLSSGETYSVASACEGIAVGQEADDERPGGSLRPRIASGGGSAMDWFYHELGARYSYQIKLRDTGSYGFLLPSEHIVPTGEEVFNAMKYFGDYLLGNNGIEKFGGEEGGEPTARPLAGQSVVAETAASEEGDDDEWRELRRTRRRR